MAYQTYIHHIMGSTGFYMTLYTQGVTASFGVMSLVIEFSTIFLNTRWFCYELGLSETTFSVVNQFAVLISYTLIRVVYQFYVSFCFCYWGYNHQFLNYKINYSQELLDKTGRNFYAYQAMGLFMLISNILSQCINTYWYGLIVK